MRISDWSSDVCSSDLDGLLVGALDLVEEALGQAPDRGHGALLILRQAGEHELLGSGLVTPRAKHRQHFRPQRERVLHFALDRKSVGEGKSVSVRVDLGGRRIVKEKTNK